MEFKDKLKVLREKKNYSQEDIASKLEIKPQEVENWEKGTSEPDITMIKKLCNILDCSLSSLLDDDEEVLTQKEEKNKEFTSMILKSAAFLAATVTLLIIGLFFLAPSSIVVRWSSDFTPEYGSKGFLFIGLIPILFVIGMNFFVYYFNKDNKEFIRYRLSLQVAMHIILGLISLIVLVLSILMVVKSKTKTSMDTWTSFISLSAISCLIPISILSHPKINKKNFLMGFRTTFTLSNDKAWYLVNRFTSYAMLIASIIAYILNIIFIKNIWSISFIAVPILALIPAVIYHQHLKKKLIAE